MTDRAVPNLPSRDLDATAAFYGAFGFERRSHDDGWLVLHRGDLQLEFFPAPDVSPETSEWMCSIRVADVDALYCQILDAGVREGTSGHPRLHPVRRESSGLRIGYLVDLDGTQLHLIEDAGDADAR